MEHIRFGEGGDLRAHDRISQDQGALARLRRGASRLTVLAMLASGAMLLPVQVQVALAQKLVAITGTHRTTSVTITVGKNEDIRLDAPFSDVMVGDPDVADVNPLTDRALSILGKKVGTTRVSVYGEGKKLLGVFDVEVAYDVSRLQSEIRRLAGGGINVTSVNGRLMLTGSASDAVTLDRAVSVAKQFAPDVINSVSVMQQQQVMLEVRFIEASRQTGRDLGMQWNVFGSKAVANIGSRRDSNFLPVTAPTTTPNNVNGQPTGLPIGEIAAGVLSGGSPFGVMLGRMVTGGTTVDVVINALEERGLIRTLAEPNLIALSGDTASFLAGGEFPIPVPGQLGSITIEYKRYGVGLAFTPTVLRDGLINLKIEPEVSQLDTAHPVTVASIAVPPLIVRRASTTVELRDGQSFVIGGLLQSRNSTSMQQLPWLGDVPVLGALFRSASYQKNETDLAIIVTPRLVRPIAPGQPVRSPLDNSLPPNDADVFLMGRTEVPNKAARIAAGDIRPFSGHMLDLPKGSADVAVQ